ncbi:hypothetical protein [Krasilnikovia sp. M28-CT-15]|uniref:hypothetical protein n=1 Tax=Krasilnikovia sp. M28-CT-15 TaxID=3373540 RepID=UPI003875F765
MAVPMYPQAPAPKTRPALVTISSYLLYATAALSLIGAVIGLSSAGTMSEVYREAYRGTAAEGTETVAVVASVIGIVVNVLFAAGLAVLAIFNGRGRNGSRITTWVLGGIALCCSGVGLAGTAVSSSLNVDTGGGSTGPSARELERRLNEALPSWYAPVTTILSVLMLLTLLGALVLLALPASNAYFRAAQPAWDPSQPYPAYPGYPGAQPPYPGQQPYSAQPPGQPFPGQPFPGQPFPGQPLPGQPLPGQPLPGQLPYPGQAPAAGGLGYPGQAAYPGIGQPTGPAPEAIPPVVPTPPEATQPSWGQADPSWGQADAAPPPSTGWEQPPSPGAAPGTTSPDTPAQASPADKAPAGNSPADDSTGDSSPSGDATESDDRPGPPADPTTRP